MEFATSSVLTFQSEQSNLFERQKLGKLHFYAFLGILGYKYG